MVKQSQALLWPLTYLVPEMSYMFIYYTVNIVFWADYGTLPLASILWLIAIFTDDNVSFSWQWVGTFLIAGGQIFANYWFNDDLRKYYMIYVKPEIEVPALKGITEEDVEAEA